MNSLVAELLMNFGDETRHDTWPSTTLSKSDNTIVKARWRYIQRIALSRSHTTFILEVSGRGPETKFKLKREYSR